MTHWKLRCPPRRSETSYLCWCSPSLDRDHNGPAWVGLGSTIRAGSSSKRHRKRLAGTCRYLLLDAPIEELTQTEKRAAGHHRLEPLRWFSTRWSASAWTPAACAGHSLGEYTALVASGALSFEHGIQLVVARGNAMARAGEDAPGTMAALLGIADDDAEAACQRAEGDVWPVANYNAPGQVVIAGTVERRGQGRASWPRNWAPRR